MKFTTSFELNDLPIELLSIVFTYTDGLFLLTTAQQVCKQWYQCVNTTSEELWITLFKQQFPETTIVMEQLHHDENVAIEPMNHRSEFVKKAEQLFERRREIFESARESIGTEFVKELFSDKWMKDARFAFGHQLKLIGTKMSEDKIPVGYSKTGGAPDLPQNYELKLSSPENAEFLFQINLDHASFFIEPGVLLPKRGMLYVYVAHNGSHHADVFYLSSSEIKQFGGLIRTNPNQHKEKDDDPLTDKVTSAILQFSYNFSFSDGIKDDDFPEFTLEQVDFIRTMAKKYKENIRYYEERLKQVSFSLFGWNELECDDCLEITDEYITEVNFNGIKIVSLDQLLPENEQTAVVSKLLEQYNADHPDDQYEVVFKETQEQYKWFQTTELGLYINERNFDIEYLYDPEDKQELYFAGHLFKLATSSNDQIPKRDGFEYSGVSNHILFMKQSLYDQCEQREPLATMKRNETRLWKAKLEQEGDEVLKRKQEEVDRQEEERKQQAKLSGRRYIQLRERTVYYPSLFKSYICMPPCTVFSDLLYFKDPAWKPNIGCFIQWFSGENIGLESGSWELYMRQGQYLKDNGDYNFNCIQVNYSND
jgi:hypothetical protein